ncbi:MAG: preprotein translocase subunit SecE [Clostridia bacterium]|nr:preprotein translocase subunit SecE [Clostridia bacterium]
MANIVDKDNMTKTLRLFVILLLVVGIVTLAVTVYDLASGSSLLKLFDAKEVAAETAEETAEAAQTAETTAVDPNWGGQIVAYIMLAVASALLVIGGIMYFVKNSYQSFQGTCIAAIIFALYPLIFFAVNIGTHLFALIYTVLILAIIVLSIIAMKSRWQVYIKEMTGEVKKLTWLNMKELVKATAVVLVFVLAFALLIYVLDLIFYTPVKALLTDSKEPTATVEPAENETPADTTDGAEEGAENNE